jgi:hypothetical protein
MSVKPLQTLKLVVDIARNALKEMQRIAHLIFRWFFVVGAAIAHGVEEWTLQSRDD